jgi:hypothetical protein
MTSGVRSASFSKRLWLFMQRSYAPGIHIGYSVLVFCAVEALTRLLHPELRSHVWMMTPRTLLGIFVLFVLLFQIRAADEIKDLDYDKEHNPDRPLVTGEIAIGDVWVFMLLSTALALGGAFLLGGFALVLAGVVCVYAIVLLGLERWFPALGERLFLNMLVTFPINLVCNSFAFFVVLHQADVRFDGKVLTLVLSILAASFLQYEFARKTSWPQHTPKGKRFYSSLIGAPMTVLLLSLLAVAAPVGLILLVPPWENSGAGAWAGYLLFLPLFVLMFGVKKFLRIRGEAEVRKAALIGPMAMAAMAIFMGIVCVYAISILGFGFGV